MSNSITKAIELRAPIDRVWRAISDPAEFGVWFRVAIETPFAPGEPARGRITHPGYEHVVWEVRIVAMEAPRLFSFTWHPYAIDTDVDYSPETPTLVEFRLEPVGEGSRLTVTETGFDALPQHRRAGALRMNDSGWAEQMKNIAAHVQG